MDSRTVPACVFLQTIRSEVYFLTVSSADRGVPSSSADRSAPSPTGDGTQPERRADLPQPGRPGWIPLQPGSWKVRRSCLLRHAGGAVLEGPYIQVTDTGAVVSLRPDVTTVGRGSLVDVRLTDPSVSLLHAEIIRRGPYTYVSDLGLSRNGTRVNGRLVARRVLSDGDALAFGSARCRIAGIEPDELADAEISRPAAPELPRRELDVIPSLCRPAMSDDAFVTPATAREIAADLVVTEAAVKQHLLRLYSKLRIPEGLNRRIRLANEVVALGLARPQLPDDQRGTQVAPAQNVPAPRPALLAPAVPRHPPTMPPASRPPASRPPALGQVSARRSVRSE